MIEESQNHFLDFLHNLGRQSIELGLKIHSTWIKDCCQVLKLNQVWLEYRNPRETVSEEDPLRLFLADWLINDMLHTLRLLKNRL
jgi:hypothetical protein